MTVDDDNNVLDVEEEEKDQTDESSYDATVRLQPADHKTKNTHPSQKSNFLQDDSRKRVRSAVYTKRKRRRQEKGKVHQVTLKQFQTSINETHFQRLGSFQFECEHCGGKFAHQKGLNEHLRDSCPFVKRTPYKCPQCPRTHTSKKSFGEHMAQHDEHVLYQCGEPCSLKFGTRTTFTAHLKTCKCKNGPGFKNESPLKYIVTKYPKLL